MVLFERPRFGQRHTRGSAESGGGRRLLLERGQRGRGPLLSRSPLRSLAALAFVLLALAGLKTVHDRNAPRAGAGAGARRPQAAEVAPRRPEIPSSEARLPDGSLLLRWRAAPGAEAYRVHLYAHGMAPAATLEVGRDSTLTLDRARAERLAGDGDALFWRVSALRGGEPLTGSRLRLVTVDRP